MCLWVQTQSWVRRLRERISKESNCLCDCIGVFHTHYQYYCSITYSHLLCRNIRDWNTRIWSPNPNWKRSDTYEQLASVDARDLSRESGVPIFCWNKFNLKWFLHILLSLRPCYSRKSGNSNKQRNKTNLIWNSLVVFRRRCLSTKTNRNSKRASCFLSSFENVVD